MPWRGGGDGFMWSILCAYSRGRAGSLNGNRLADGTDALERLELATRARVRSWRNKNPVVHTEIRPANHDATPFASHLVLACLAPMGEGKKTGYLPRLRRRLPGFHESYERCLSSLWNFFPLYFQFIPIYHLTPSTHIYIYTHNLHMRSEKPGSRLVGSGFLFSLLLIIPFRLGEGREVTQSSSTSSSVSFFYSSSLPYVHLLGRSVIKPRTGGSIFRGSGSGKGGWAGHLF